MHVGQKEFPRYFHNSSNETAKVTRMFLIMFLCISAFAKGDPSVCASLLPTAELSALDVQHTLFPDRDQLSRICPGFLSFSRCFQQALEDTPEDFDDDTLPIYHSLDDSFGDLCSEDSAMKESYLSNVDCLRSIKSSWPDCRNESEDIYRGYKASAGGREEKSDEDCFKRSYSVGCMSENIFKGCGQDAVDVYQLFMRKYKYISQACDASATEDFRATYMDYLNFTGSRKSVYESAFNLAS